MNIGISPERVRALLGTAKAKPVELPKKRGFYPHKLTAQDVTEIRAMRQMGSKMEALAHRYGVGRSMISMICNNTRRSNNE